MKNILIIAFLGSISLLLQQTCYAKNKLASGEMLLAEQSITSENGNYTLIMQGDGSLVMYRKGGTVRYRMAKHGTFAIMQTDGNFVEYVGNTTNPDNAIWSSGTAGVAQWPPYLYIDNYGDLSIISTNSSGSMTFSVWGIGQDFDPASTTNIETLQPPGPPPQGKPILPYRPDVDNSANNNMYPRY
ncbi:hypothetical protein [Rugamonas aquatica]|nr:hypothetical protein [Rugamonas aquatica]